MNLYLNNIAKFLGIFALQVLIISHLELSYYINPYIHLLFLLTLPVSIPLAYLLLLGFVSGLTLDMFLNTTGLHAAASVLLAFIRPVIINIITPKGSLDLIQTPNIFTPSITWFINYLVVSSIIYLSFYFTLEVFSLKDFGQTLLKILFSTIASVLLMLMIAYLFSPNKKKRGS